MCGELKNSKQSDGYEMYSMSVWGWRELLCEARKVERAGHASE